MPSGMLPACLLMLGAAPAGAQSVPGIEEITVVAKRLDQARNQIQPSLGATVHLLDPVALAQVPQGANAPLNQVLLQLPGVAQDSFGQLHVRGDHNEVQYRIDGVQLPEGLAVFGQVLETRLADSIALIDGALPAQYGFLQAGVIDIRSRSGTTNPGGEVSIYGGSRDEAQDSVSYGTHAGRWSMFVTADFLHSRVGIENPAGSFNAIHDLSNQYHAVAHISYLGGESSRIDLLAGVSSAQFQLPNNPGQTPLLGYELNGTTTYDSADLREHQREATDFAILSLQRSVGDLDVQSALFTRYSSLYFSPDPVGDLLFTGIAQRAARSVWSSGAQTDASWRLGAAHTLRLGFQITGERGVSATQSSLFDLDLSGGQIGAQPVTLHQGAGRTGTLYGAYAQDEWRITPVLTLNYGLRFDGVNEYAHASQVSPRVDLVWRPRPGTTLHAGYAHYLTPPPFELVDASSVLLLAGTSAAAPSQQNTIVKAEHDSYFDVGIEQTIIPGLHIGLDGYSKSARNLIDEGQFGAPIILTAFNYAHGQVSGAELSADYRRGPVSAYANLAYSRAIGKDINSAQFNFSPDDLDYIAHHWIHLDHDQRWTGSGGVAYTLFAATASPLRASADISVGSGLRADGAVPNGRALPGYSVIDVGVVQNLGFLSWHELTARIDVLNLLDRRYEIRDGSGVGVGAPQFGLRRSLLGGLTQKF